MFDKGRTGSMCTQDGSEFDSSRDRIALRDLSCMPTSSSSSSISCSLSSFLSPTGVRETVPLAFGIFGLILFVRGPVVDEQLV